MAKVTHYNVNSIPNLRDHCQSFPPGKGEICVLYKDCRCALVSIPSEKGALQNVPFCLNVSNFSLPVGCADKTKRIGCGDHRFYPTPPGSFLRYKFQFIELLDGCYGAAAPLASPGVSEAQSAVVNDSPVDCQSRRPGAPQSAAVSGRGTSR